MRIPYKYNPRYRWLRLKARLSYSLYGPIVSLSCHTYHEDGTYSLPLKCSHKKHMSAERWLKNRGKWL